MRLFIAVELPRGLHEALAETSSLLRGCVRGRYVAPDSFHVTLAFLGEVESYRVVDASNALDEGCRGFPSFPLALGELGRFGRVSSATLWQGFRRHEVLDKLAQSVRASLDSAGFDFDAKSFLPHVTLMRSADLGSGTLPMPVLSEGVIDTVSLFKSDLSGNRPQYEALHTVFLQEPF